MLVLNDNFVLFILGSSLRALMDCEIWIILRVVSKDDESTEEER